MRETMTPAEGASTPVSRQCHASVTGIEASSAVGVIVSGRVPELEDKLARATAEVDELHEAMRELEEEMTQQREAAIAESSSARSASSKIQFTN